MNRKGIIAAGNMLVDHVRTISEWPEQGRLAYIESQANCVGGSPLNVLMDLAKLNPSLPLAAIGLIGDDGDGKYILKTLAEAGIDLQWVQTTAVEQTSYTEVMTEKYSGQRTFFHSLGANRLLALEHFQSVNTNHKIFHLGYLLLLAELDSPDADYGSKAARLLKTMQQKGYKTAVDLVSVSKPDHFKATTLSALKYIDYLIINELEATGLTDIEIRGRDKKLTIENMAQAAQRLITLGVNELVAIHCPEGAYLVTARGDYYLVPSWHIDNDEIKGSVGAGDAFCAGLLYALHEGMPYEQALKLANAAARFNLLSYTSIGGAASIIELEDFMQSAALRADFLI